MNEPEFVRGDVIAHIGQPWKCIVRSSHGFEYSIEYLEGDLDEFMEGMHLRYIDKRDCQHEYLKVGKYDFNGGTEVSNG